MTTNWIGRRLVAVVRGVLLAGLAFASALLFLVHLAFFVPGFGLGLIFLPMLSILAGRPLADLARRLAGAWCAVPVAAPYRSPPPAPRTEPDGRYRLDNQLYKRPWWPACQAWMNWLLGDPATYRDLLWTLMNPMIGGVLAGLPAALVTGGTWYAVSQAGRHWWAAPAGLVATLAGFALAPGLLGLHGRWTRLLLRPVRPLALTGWQAWVSGRLLAIVRLLALCGLTLVNVPLAALTLLGLVLSYGIGLIVLMPPLIEHFRWLPELRRRLARDWSGVGVATPYLPRPALPAPRPDGLYRVGNRLYRTPRWTAYNQRMRWLTRDPASWRDMLWQLIDPIGGGVLLLAPLGAIGYGFFGLLLPRIWVLFGMDPENLHGWQGTIAGSAIAAVPTGLGLLALGVAIAPAVLRLHGRWSAVLLGPTERARLALRVQRLTETRADATEAQATELRRIERDLHDGAQARLVAVGLTLNNIEHLLDRDPSAARALLAEARETSAKALVELRDLVRGIHPPVLAERGLGDAIRALALDLPLPVEVSVELAGRPEAPIESATYFAVSELLTNAVRHANADRVTVDIRYADGRLHAVVCDDGSGGADPARGSGLRGIERRLGTFDGVVVVSSPSGGPTTVTLELPCVLSSPKTSTC